PSKPVPPEPASASTAEAGSSMSAKYQSGTESAAGADALYADAMTQIRGGEAQEARKTLHRVLEQDPHYAKAHFRMGEIALLNRNLNYASKELQAALEDTGRLGPREEQLTRVSLAIATHDKPEVERLSA